MMDCDIYICMYRNKWWCTNMSAGYFRQVWLLGHFLANIVDFFSKLLQSFISWKLFWSPSSTLKLHHLHSFCLCCSLGCVYGNLTGARRRATTTQAAVCLCMKSVFAAVSSRAWRLFKHGPHVWHTVKKTKKNSRVSPSPFALPQFQVCGKTFSLLSENVQSSPLFFFCCCCHFH